LRRERKGRGKTEERGRRGEKGGEKGTNLQIFKQTEKKNT
jgi:hypothetical protein